MSSPKNRPEPQSLHLPFAGADSHAHLDDEQIFPDIKEILTRAVQSGVSLVVSISLSHQRYASSVDTILTLAKEINPALKICFVRGIHPEDILQIDEKEWDNLKADITADNRICAVGEIGLDYHYDEGDSPPILQKKWFRRQLRLAKEVDKPIVIHSRDAWEDTFDILEEEGLKNYPLLWHCFGGTSEQAKRIISNGWHIAFGGASTYKANEAVREALHEIPLDRLLLETDCPYLSPLPWRGKRNEPAFTVFTAERLAKELSLSSSDLWTITGDNAKRFFGIF